MTQPVTGDGRLRVCEKGSPVDRDASAYPKWDEVAQVGGINAESLIAARDPDE